MRVHRVISAAAACAMVVALGIAFTSTARSQGPASSTEKSGKKFKNVKILKDLPANQMVPTMMVVSRSLGVRCEFCHTERDFASDAKHTKVVARQMLVMTNDLNKNVRVVDKKVTCFMCHRGEQIPNGNVSSAGPRRSAGGEGPRD